MTAPQIEFTDPRTTPFAEPRWRGHLPHLYKEGGSYFVTFRLWDAVVPKGERDPSFCGAGVPPAFSITQKDETAGGTPAPQGKQVRPKSREEIAAESEPPLRLGSCVLEHPDVAALVQKALLHFHTQRYDLHAWCVMPNHVHVVYTARGEHTPADIHHSWKSYTAHKANKILKRSDEFWESEGFDHLIRSVEDLEWFIEYIENNPVTAGLCANPADWLWTSARPGNWVFPAQEPAQS
jgi:REP element-mobilizing transposase RayT